MAVLFDTTSIDPRERPDSWAEAHRRIFFPIGVRLTSGDASNATIEGRSVGPLAAYRVAGDASVVRRSGPGIREYDPEQLLVAMPMRGRTVIEQSGRTSVFDPGDLSSWDSSHPFSVTHTEPFELLLLSLPRPLLGPRRDLICRRTGERIASSSKLGALATPLFRQLWELIGADAGVQAREDLADEALALVRTMYAAEASEATPARHLPRLALVLRVKAHIDQNLGDPRLGPQSIARAHHISTRYLHRLFSAEGASVSEWVRRRRLEACHRDLRDPARAHETISEVAQRWALSNPAHFSRIFRQAYGCTPSELRRSAR